MIQMATAAFSRSRVLQRVAVCGSVWQCVAVCCSVLQCMAVCGSALQCVAVCCSVLRVAVCCSVWQCVAVCCSVWQFVAECCRDSTQTAGGNRARVAGLLVCVYMYTCAAGLRVCMYMNIYVAGVCACVYTYIRIAGLMSERACTYRIPLKRWFSAERVLQVYSYTNICAADLHHTLHHTCVYVAGFCVRVYS